MGDFPTQYGAGLSFHAGQNSSIASATPHVKGAWGTQMTSTPYDCNGLIVGFSGNNSINLLGDIAVGAAASEVIIVPNMMCSGLAHQSHIYVPIFIPAGSRIAGRVQASTGSTSGYFALTGVTSPLWGAPVGGKIVDLATVAASSRGTLLDGGPTINTYPATFTTVVASTTERISALCLSIACSNNATPALAFAKVQIGIGAASSEVALIEVGTLSAGNICSSCHPFWFPADIPSGSRISARVAIGTTDATDRIIQLGLHGLVA